jgi:hypothetical protein
VLDERFTFAACHASAASSKVGTVRRKACIQRFLIAVPANLAFTSSAIQPLTRSKATPIGPDGKAPHVLGAFSLGTAFGILSLLHNEGV